MSIRYMNNNLYGVAAPIANPSFGRQMTTAGCGFNSISAPAMGQFSMGQAVAGPSYPQAADSSKQKIFYGAPSMSARMRLG